MPNRPQFLEAPHAEPSASVALLDADPAFGAGVPAADAALAARVLRLPRLDLALGAWEPPARDAWPAPTRGVLILGGILGRHVALGDRVATHLLGPGDLVDPWTRGGEMVPSETRWSVHAPVTAVVLDGRFATAACRWPGLAAISAERFAAGADRLATHLAICQLPRVEARVLALLWQLADRFGRVTPAGVAVPLRLTHRLIGELVGAQRPTVSLALSALLEDGSVTRRDDGSLVLALASRAHLEATGTPAPPVPAPAAPLALLSADVGPERDLGERVRLLRGDFTAQRERTVALVTRSASLRRRRAILAAERRAATAPDGAQAAGSGGAA